MEALSAPDRFVLESPPPGAYEDPKEKQVFDPKMRLTVQGGGRVVSARAAGAVMQSGYLKTLDGQLRAEPSSVSGARRLAQLDGRRELPGQAEQVLP